MRTILKMRTMLMINVLMTETQMITTSTMTNHLKRKKKEEEEEVDEGKTKMVKARGEGRSTGLLPKHVGIPQGGGATQG